MKQTLHTLYAALLLTLAGCAGNHDAPAALDGNEGNDPDAPIEFSTRSTTGGGEELKTIFLTGTEIGIKVDGYDEYSNAKYKYEAESGKFVPAERGSGIYFSKAKEESMKQATYTAYYPYNDTGDYDNPTINANQSTEESYYNSDALTSTGKLGEPMVFTHRMAKAIIKFSEKVESVSIEGQPLQEGGTPDQTIQAFNAEEDGKTWRAILVPGTRTIAIVITKRNGEIFRAEFKEKTLERNNQYTFTINGLYPVVEIKNLVNLTEYVNSGKDTYTITGSNASYYFYQDDPNTPLTCSIVVKNGGSPTLYLDGVNLQTDTWNVAPLHIQTADEYGESLPAGKTNPTIVLVNESKLHNIQAEGNFPAIWLNGSDAHLNIVGDGKLTAEVENPQKLRHGAPAIGAKRYGGSAGNITISDCTVTVRPGQQAAGIGVGGGAADISESHCGDITITNATIHTIPYKDWSMACAIGTGYAQWNGENSYSNLSCGNITITGSTIISCTQNRIGNGYSDGNCHNKCGKVTITGTTFKY